MNSELKTVDVVVVAVLTTSPCAVTFTVSFISEPGRRVIVVVIILPETTSTSCRIVDIWGKETSRT